MIKNLLLVAIRNFKRDKWYSLLNIIGLTIGITFSLFLIFYIKDELSYDRYNEMADRIFRINSHIKEKDKDTMRWAVTPFPMGPALSHDYPEVEEAVRFYRRQCRHCPGGTQNHGADPVGGRKVFREK